MGWQGEGAMARGTHVLLHVSTPALSPAGECWRWCHVQNRCVHAAPHVAVVCTFSM
jgi:hypothetical protein